MGFWLLCWRLDKDAILALTNVERTQLGIAAGAGHAGARIGVEYGAVMSADQPVVVIGQEAVRREIERPCLVGAEIDPHPGLSIAARSDQPQRLAVVIDPEFAITSLGEFIAGAKEHGFIHGV